MFTFNFGRSFSEGRPVSEILAIALPRTLFLFGGALIAEYLVGIAIGRFIAWHRGKTEGLAIVSSLFFYNMPSFWIGLILLWAFGFAIPIFPLNGYSDPTWTAQHFPSLARGSFLFQAADIVMHGALPMLALVLINAAGPQPPLETPVLQGFAGRFIPDA